MNTNSRAVCPMNQLGMFFGLELERTAGSAVACLAPLACSDVGFEREGAIAHPFSDIVRRELFGLPGRVASNRQAPLPTTWQMTRYYWAKNSQVVAGVLRDLVVLRRAQS